MATAKKSASAKSKPKKVPAKSSKPSNEEYKSFRVSKQKTPFFSFSLTKQTIYWTILLLVILIFGLWIIRLHIEVYNIYDEIEASNAVSAIKAE